MGQQTDPTVRHFRQILLWPLELIAAPSDDAAAPWELLAEAEPDALWRVVDDEFPDDPALFQERHYGEFATFLPYVQRLLYGEGATRGVGRGQSPIRVLRRTDVARARLTYPDASEPVVLDVVHVDLYAFYDVDVVILVVELAGGDLALRDAQDTLYRLGRAYPTHWTAEGQGGHCVTRAEWLDAGGAVLAVSDYEKREKYLAHVGRYRAPAIAAHWEFLLTPMVPHHSGQRGELRYRPVEYHRMPQLAYLAVDRPRAVSRADFVRLALVTAPGPSGVLPFSERHVAEFQRRHIDDRYWDEAGEGGSRYACSGEAMIVFGGAGDRYFADREMGVLAHFRHQQFLLFLIPHFHKAALVLMSDRLVDAVNHLDVSDPESVKRFKRRIRQLKETFLRFTHRYWFHELSDQAQAKALYRMSRESLDTERLFAEVREEIQDMSEYLDSDSLRRQANMVIRLTVVTIVGLIGTITTGFLGMNLLAAAESSWAVKAAYFALVLVPTTALTAWTIARSRRLSDFLEALSDERLPTRAKLGALLEVWRRRRPPSPPATR
jgi:hypothetical protein